MKGLQFTIMLLILFLSYAGNAQHMTAFIKDTATWEFSLEAFKKQNKIQLSDSSKKVRSYMVVIISDVKIGESYKFDPVAMEISGNSLKNNQLIRILDEFKGPFKLFFENIRYYDDNVLKSAKMINLKIRIKD